jgi:hypothetical protein
MESIVRNVAEIDSVDRRAIERLLGSDLADHQQIIIRVVDLEPAKSGQSAVSAIEDVPAWWRIYEGLSDEDVDRLDGAIHPRADLTRVFE